MTAVPNLKRRSNVAAASYSCIGAQQIIRPRENIRLCTLKMYNLRSLQIFRGLSPLHELLKLLCHLSGRRGAWATTCAWARSAGGSSSTYQSRTTSRIEHDDAWLRRIRLTGLLRSEMTIHATFSPTPVPTPSSRHCIRVRTRGMVRAINHTDVDGVVVLEFVVVAKIRCVSCERWFEFHRFVAFAAVACSSSRPEHDDENAHQRDATPDEVPRIRPSDVPLEGPRQ